MSDTQIKSRLGLLLIRKGLINQTQLDQALQLQITSNKRLGEVLIEQGFLNQRQLNKALKKQSRHRFWAAIMTMLLGPLSFGAFAGQSSNQSQAQDSAHSVQFDQYQGLKALDENELDDVQGQGFQSPHEAYQSLLALSEGSDELELENDLGALDDITSLLLPMTSLLDADVTVSGVEYSKNPNKQIIHEDGSIELRLPTKIAEIAMRNLRVKGADTGRSFGDVVISNIQFSEHSSIRIRVRD